MPHHGRRHKGHHGIGRAIGRAVRHANAHHHGHHGHRGHHGGHHHHHVPAGAVVGAAVVGGVALGGAAAYAATRSSGQPSSSGGYGGRQPRSSGGYGGGGGYSGRQPVASGGYARAAQPAPQVIVVQQPPTQVVYAQPQPVQRVVQQPVASGGYGGGAQPVAAKGGYGGQPQPVPVKQVYVPPPAQPVQPSYQPVQPVQAQPVQPVQVIQQPGNPYYSQQAAQQVVRQPIVPAGSIAATTTTTTTTSGGSASASAAAAASGVVAYPVIQKVVEMKQPEGGVTRKVDDQPLPDARPSVKTAVPFTDEIAHDAAKGLQKAMKGFGSDKKTMATITGNHNHAQRIKIKQIFGTFGKKERRNLMKDLNSETSGEFRKLIMLCYAEPGAADAKWMKEAVDGRSYNTDLLCEILLTRTNAQLEAMKAAWPKIEKGSLKSRLAEETSKMFSSGNFKTFVLKVLEAKRPANEPFIDEAKLKADAEYLNRMANSGGKEAKSAFIKVMTERSWRHLHHLSGKFQQISKKYTLASAAKKALGDSDTGKGVAALIEFTSAPYDYFAKRLFKAMDGVGTDNCKLRRVVVSRCEIDLASIAEVFGSRHGKGKTLRNWIDGEVSGPNKQLLLALCGLDG